MSETLTALGQIGLVPVVKIDRAADAVPLGQALVAGGLPCAEITFRTAAAEESIRNLAAALPEMLLGAGTVLTVEQAEKAVSAGARFIVSPGFGPAVVDWCQRQGVPVLPGVATPTEIMMALDKGIKIVKFFPAEALGGIATLKAFERAVWWGQVHADRRRRRGQPARLPGAAHGPRLRRHLDGGR